jgi:hypothetical protein
LCFKVLLLRRSAAAHAPHSCTAPLRVCSPLLCVSVRSVRSRRFVCLPCRVDARVPLAQRGHVDLDGAAPRHAAGRRVLWRGPRPLLPPPAASTVHARHRGPYLTAAITLIVRPESIGGRLAPTWSRSGYRGQRLRKLLPGLAAPLGATRAAATAAPMDAVNPFTELAPVDRWVSLYPHTPVRWFRPRGAADRADQE